MYVIFVSPFSTKNEKIKSQIRLNRRQNAVRPMAGDPFWHLVSTAIDAFHDALQLIQPGAEHRPDSNRAKLWGRPPFLQPNHPSFFNGHDGWDTPIHTCICMYIYYICIRYIQEFTKCIHKWSQFVNHLCFRTQNHIQIKLNFITSVSTWFSHQNDALWDAPTDRIRRTLRNHLGASASPCPSTAPDESTSAPRHLETSLLPVIRAPSDLVIRGQFLLFTVYIFVHMFFLN